MTTIFGRMTRIEEGGNCVRDRSALRAAHRQAAATGNKNSSTLPLTQHDALQECLASNANFPLQPGQVYCNGTFDSFLCWPPTPAGQMASQNCPAVRLSDTAHAAYRRCSDNGEWLGRHANETSAIGWTNYTPCFPPEVQTLFIKMYENEVYVQRKFEIAQRTRDMEIAGFSISLVALLISLIIFSYYRSLRNNRTRIHKSLFSAMIVQVIIRLTLYIDQALTRNSNEVNIYDNDVQMRGIDNMPYLCEISYILLEYAITVMFMWMFIEGLYLNNVVTSYALRERSPYFFYYFLGWGFPVMLTVVWAITTALHYQREQVKRCWYGYNFSTQYWIVQAPRLGVILINLLFLFNIMRVLIVKLKRSQNSEVQKVRKAVRAAFVLLPLLGITNGLSMLEAPLDGNVWQFALWSYTTHFLRSFQGFFIALIYCFLNAEVRQVLKKHYHDYMAMRDHGRQRDSFFNFMSSSGDRRPQENNQERSDGRHSWIPLMKFKSNQVAHDPNQQYETEMGPDTIPERYRSASNNNVEYTNEGGATDYQRAGPSSAPDATDLSRDPDTSVAA